MSPQRHIWLYGKLAILSLKQWRSWGGVPAGGPSGKQAMGERERRAWARLPDDLRQWIIKP